MVWCGGCWKMRAGCMKVQGHVGIHLRSHSQASCSLLFPDMYTYMHSSRPPWPVLPNSEATCIPMLQPNMYDECRAFQVLSMMTNLEKYDEARKAAQAVSPNHVSAMFHSYTHTHALNIHTYIHTYAYHSDASMYPFTLKSGYECMFYKHPLNAFCVKHQRKSSDAFKHFIVHAPSQRIQKVYDLHFDIQTSETFHSWDFDIVTSASAHAFRHVDFAQIKSSGDTWAWHCTMWYYFDMLSYMQAFSSLSVCF